jgi:predicted RNA-binding Zn-ribbon protein involved in translation (DUF1610 family)
MDICPACGSDRVFRSRTRTALERYRRQLTRKRPYRCHACDWRGWGADDLLVSADGDLADAPPAPPDLVAIDSALLGVKEEPGEPAAGEERPAARKKPAARGAKKRRP